MRAVSSSACRPFFGRTASKLSRRSPKEKLDEPQITPRSRKVKRDRHRPLSPHSISAASLMNALLSSSQKPVSMPQTPSKMPLLALPRMETALFPSLPLARISRPGRALLQPLLRALSPWAGVSLLRTRLRAPSPWARTSLL